MIKLFYQDATNFNTMGLGSLSEALSCTVIEERNGDFTLEMEYPQSGKLFKYIGLRSIIVTKPNPFDDPQAFRVYKITKTLKKTITVCAEHISFDMSGIVVGPFASGVGYNAILSAIISNTVPVQDPLLPGTFSLSADFSEPTDKSWQNTVPVSLRAILGDQSKSMLSNFGGEWKFDNYHATLYEKRGQDRGVVIKYGVDLTDLKQEEECSELFTGIAPYYKDPESDATVMLDDIVVRVEDAYTEDPPHYDYEKYTSHDFTNSFDNIPTKQALIDETKRYIRDEKIGIPKVNLTLSFANLRKTMEYSRFTELQKVMLCDTITVLFPEMNIRTTARVEKIEYDAIKEEYKSIDVGEAKKTLADTISGNSTDIEKIPTTYATVTDVTGTKIIQKVNAVDTSATGNTGINATQVATSGNQNVEEALSETLKGVTTYYGSFNEGVTPTRESSGWTTSSPARQEGKNIWQYVDYYYADNHHEYTPPINLSGTKGADGKSINILGSYNTLAELQAAHPTGNVGDGYLVNGDLYVWDPSLSSGSGGWKNVGRIKGQSLSKVTTEYGTSDDPQVEPTSWSTTSPTYNPTLYIWTREKQDYVDPIETKYSDPVIDNSLTGFGSQLYQQGNKIALVVKSDGGDHIDSGAIMLAINGDGSTATINANKTQITGMLTNGQTTVNGNCIQTGLIISQDGESYFDLTNGVLSASQWQKDRFRMIANEGTLGGVTPIVYTDIQCAQDNVSVANAWSASINYTTNSLCRQDDVLWIALVANTNKKPGTKEGHNYWTQASWSSIFRVYTQNLRDGHESTGNGFAFQTDVGWYDFNDMVNPLYTMRHLGVRLRANSSIFNTPYSRVLNGITCSGVVTVPGVVSGPATVNVTMDQDMAYLQPGIKPYVTASFYDDGVESNLAQSGQIRITNVTVGGFTINIDNATDGRPRRVAWIAHKNPDSPLT